MMQSEDSETKQDKSQRLLLWPVRLVILTAFLDLHMQFPVVAPYARELGAPAAMVAIIVAAYSATNMVGNVIAGIVIDRMGRKVPLICGLLATAVTLVGYSLAETPVQLLAARLFHGLTASVITPAAYAILGDMAGTGVRARVMGVSSAFIAGAAVIGPLVAGVLRDWQGSGSVFLLSACLMVITSLVSWSLVKAPPRKKADEPAREKSEAGFPGLFRRPGLVVSYLGALVLTACLGILVTHLPIIFAVRGEAGMRTGLAFTSFAVMAMLVMVSPLGRISDRYGRLKPAIAGLVLVAAGMAVLYFSRGFAGAALGMGVFGLGFGLLFPAITALASESVGWEHRGKAFGLFYAIFSLGVVIGALASGALAQMLGSVTVMPFIAGAAISLIAVPVIAAVWRLEDRIGREDG